MLMQWAINFGIALMIFILGKWIARLLAGWLERIMQLRGVENTLVVFLSNIVFAVLLTAVILASLDTLGFPITSLLAVVGAAGLAVGLAMKDSLGNFAAGVMLVIFRPFGTDDVVEVGGVTGKVEAINIFNTVLVTPDNKQVIIPNGQVGADTIINYTAKQQRRVDLVFGVAYDDDLKKARAALEKICAEHPMVLKDPATSIFVLSLGDSSVNFAVRPWTKTDDYWTVWGDLLEQGKAELEAAGCSIPFPQRDVHLYQYEQTS
ncbi:MAG TPA: mechanosensitive ion channel domain-containing protein [Xanthomonadales bacterium]|nr:mechanosensitive ion channel domain-containing protein [Xanthomonadales bacterium]